MVGIVLLILEEHKGSYVREFTTQVEREKEIEKKKKVKKPWICILHLARARCLVN